MGVHISFVRLYLILMRSVQLDSWSIDQLRVMKCGGNQAAKEFLRDSVANLDAKSRYSSRQMLQYKQKLQSLVQDDIKRNPDELVLEHVEQEVVAEPKKDDDFFSEWSEPGELAPKVQKSPTLTRMAFKAPFIAPTVAAVTPKIVEPVKVEQMGLQIENLKSDRPTFESNTDRTAMPMESKTSAPAAGTNSGKKKFGSRKITKGIDFDEAARIAEAEQQKLAAEKAMKATNRLTNEKPAQSPRMDSESRASRLSYRDPNESNSTEKVEQKFQKLGFGFNPAEMEKKQETGVGNKLAADKGKPPTGFGFAGTPPTSNSSSVGQKFDNAKSISSDQYFNRGQYNEREQLYSIN